MPTDLAAWPCICGTDVNAGQMTARMKLGKDPAIGLWEVRNGQPTVEHDEDRCRKALN